MAREPLPTYSVGQRQVAASTTLGFARPQIAASWWQGYYNAFESYLGTRQGMLQFGAVGMFVALSVIWYRRP
jgi:hypothetical protein